MKKLNMSDAVKSIATQTGLSEKSSREALKAVISFISNALAKGEEARFIGFGSFKVRYRKAHKGRNPQTGQTMDISARNVPAFKAGLGLKKTVNK